MGILNTLMLKTDTAQKHIDAIATRMTKDYGITVEYGKGLKNGTGYTRDGIYGTFNIYIGVSLEETGSIFKKVDDVEFLKCVCALHHEEQHIKQNCALYKNKTPDEETIQMATRKVASSENRTYYRTPDRYRYDLSEIDAEYTALLQTYKFIKRHFKHANADNLICKLVNEKAKPTPENKYFILGHYNSFGEITEVFKQHYEQAKTAKVAYSVSELRPSQEVDTKKDECIRFLQTCVRNNSADRELLTQFNQTKAAPEKDLMIASITQHLHPDIDFKRMYPCLETVDLEPEIVFGRPLQTCLQTHESDVDKELFEQRIEKAKNIGERIKAAELKARMQKEDAQILNESLLTEPQANKTHTYEP